MNGWTTTGMVLVPVGLMLSMAGAYAAGVAVCFVAVVLTVVGAVKAFAKKGDSNA